MSDVHVPYGDDQAETATLLLAAAEESEDHEAGAVRLDTHTQTFVVPEEIASAAGVDTVNPNEELEQAVADAEAENAAAPQATTTEADADESDDEADEAPAKKAASKRTAKKS